MNHRLTAIYWTRQEARYVPEYVEFHLLQGFDHFIFYEDDIDPHLQEIIRPYGDLIEVRILPPMNRARNMWLSEQCCIEQRGKSEWIHFHSLDERVYCPDGRSIPEFLQDYADYGGVAVAWEEFNSNGHITRPEGLIIEHYTQTCKDNQYHIKTIVRPEATKGFAGTPHTCVYEPGFYAVTENGTRVDTAYAPYDYSYAKIKNHHYRTLSLEEFDTKMDKGVLDHGPSQEHKRREQAADEWAYVHGGKSRWGQTTLGYNDELVKWVKPVRAAILGRYRGLEHLLPSINH